MASIFCQAINSDDDDFYDENAETDWAEDARSVLQLTTGEIDPERGMGTGGQGLARQEVLTVDVTPAPPPVAEAPGPWEPSKTAIADSIADLMSSAEEAARWAAEEAAAAAAAAAEAAEAEAAEAAAAEAAGGEGADEAEPSEAGTGVFGPISEDNA